MLISLNDSTYNCILGDDGTLDTLVYVDGLDCVISCETAAAYRTKNGGFTREGFVRFCREIVIPEFC